MNLTVLYIGRDPGITETMFRLLNARPEWTGIVTSSDAEALAVCKNQNIDLVLLGNGIEAIEEQILRAGLIAIRPALKIIQHYGGGSGLLYSEILSATQ
jgi:hypothetical protein